MLGWGFSDFFAKKSLEKVDEFALTFWIQAVGVLPVLLFVLGQREIPELTLGGVALLVLFGASEGISDVLMYRGFSKGKVSILSPIFASYTGLVVLLSVLFFREALPGFVWAGLATILAGILLINIDVRDIRKSLRRPAAITGGVPEVAGAAVIYATWMVLFDQAVSGESWAFYLLAVRGIEAIGLLSYARLRKKSLRVARGDRVWRYVALVGLTDVAAYACLTFGFSRTGYTSIVAVLSATFSLPTLILAHLYLKERVTRLQLAAAALIIAGVGVVVSV